MKNLHNQTPVVIVCTLVLLTFMVQCVVATNTSTVSQTWGFGSNINPAAPVHFLIVPREHIPTLADGSDKHQALLGKMMLLAPKLASELGAGYDHAANGSSGGFKALINTGPDGGQEVYHLHLHVMGGQRPWKSQH